jgi:hypothetical protein
MTTDRRTRTRIGGQRYGAHISPPQAFVLYKIEGIFVFGIIIRYPLPTARKPLAPAPVWAGVTAFSCIAIPGSSNLGQLREGVGPG